MLAGKTSNLGAETKTNRVEEVWPADNLNPLPQRVDNPQSKYAAIEFQSDDQTASTFDNIYEPYDADASLDINSQQQKIRKKSKRRKKPEIIEEANSTDESTAQNERNMAARKRYLAGGNRPISINMNPNANASKLLKAKINEGYEMASLESITASEVNNSAGGKKMSTFSEGLDIPLDDGSFALPSSAGSVNMAERKPPIMMTGYADVGVRSSAINSSMSISVISNDRNSFYSTQVIIFCINLLMSMNSYAYIYLSLWSKKVPMRTK